MINAPNRILNSDMIPTPISLELGSIEETLAQGWTVVRVPFTAWGPESENYVRTIGVKQAWLNSHGLVKGVDYRIVERQQSTTGFQSFTVTYCWLFQNPQWAAWFSLRWV
jgi:hypothetical protein